MPENGYIIIIFISAGTISGPFDALIDGDITFDGSNVTIWNYSNLNPIFAELVK